MAVIIAYTDDEARAFNPDASTVTIPFAIVPNNNPEHPEGFAVAFAPCQGRAPQKTAWARSSLSKDGARQCALDEIAGSLDHYGGDWNIRVVEVDPGEPWPLDGVRP